MYRPRPHPSWINTNSSCDGCTGESCLTTLLACLFIFIIPALICGENGNATTFFAIWGLEFIIGFGVYKALSPSTINKQEQETQFKNTLEQFNIPDDYEKTVVYFSKTYNISKCPMIIWIENDYLCSLLLTQQPHIVKNEITSFLEIKKDIRLDMPNEITHIETDWDYQPTFIREEFYQCIDDYKSNTISNNVYDIGNFKMYPKSLRIILDFINRPFTDYKIFYYGDNLDNNYRLEILYNLYEDNAISYIHYCQAKDEILEYILNNTSNDIQRQNRLYGLLSSKVFTQKDIEEYLQ